MFSHLSFPSALQIRPRGPSPAFKHLFYYYSYYLSLLLSSLLSLLLSLSLLLLSLLILLLSLLLLLLSLLSTSVHRPTASPSHSFSQTCMPIQPRLRLGVCSSVRTRPANVGRHHLGHRYSLNRGFANRGFRNRWNVPCAIAKTCV